jgi:hypothetical protein
MDATHPIIVAEAAEFGKPQNREFSKNACNLLDGRWKMVSEARPGNSVRTPLACSNQVRSG